MMMWDVVGERVMMYDQQTVTNYDAVVADDDLKVGDWYAVERN